VRPKQHGVIDTETKAVFPPFPPPIATTPPHSVATPPHLANQGGHVLPGVQLSVSPPASAQNAPIGGFVERIIATNHGLAAIRNPVMYLIIGAGVMIVISLLGVVLACCRPGSTRGLLTAVYLCLGLPSWIFLVFVSVSSLALRDGATELVEQYWKCLRTASTTHATTIPDVYQHLDAAASICIAAASLLLVALLAACSAVGWRVLSRHSIMCISLISGLVGAATLAVGVVLKATSSFHHQFFDGAVMGVGGAVFFVSLVGVVGSKQESKCLLRSYALALLALIVAISGVSAYLLIEGDAAVGVWLEANYDSISQHICTSAMNPLCQDGLTLTITREELHQRASAHLLEITTLLVLLLLVLVVDLLMALLLQYIVSKHGRGATAEVEVERLVADDDDL